MKVSEKLRKYFVHPSRELDTLLQQVEVLERTVDTNADELTALGKLVSTLDQGWGIVKGECDYYLIEDCVGKIWRSGATPQELLEG